VTVLDENILESQCLLVRKRRIRFRRVGRDIGRQGMLDEQIVPLLQSLRRPTFFSLTRTFSILDPGNIARYLSSLNSSGTRPVDCIEPLCRTLRQAREPSNPPFGIADTVSCRRVMQSPDSIIYFRQTAFDSELQG